MGKRKSSKKSKQVATKKPLEWIQFGAKRNRVKIEVITDDCTNDEDCSMFSRNATKTDPNGNNASSTWMMDMDESGPMMMIGKLRILIMSLVNLISRIVD